MSNPPSETGTGDNASNATIKATVPYSSETKLKEALDALAAANGPVRFKIAEEQQRAARSSLESLYREQAAEIERFRAKEQRMFPIQGWKPIPWVIAEKAYIDYANRFGRSQTLERLAERGGFGVEEMDDHYPAWREETDELVKLRAELSALRLENERLRENLRQEFE